MQTQILIKPMLARDVDETKLVFPSHGFIALCKVDGSFAFVQNAILYARSLKHHENIFTTNIYSNPDFEGLRGELIVGDNPIAEGLCRDTSSALRTIEGEPETSLWCFDYVTHDTKDLPYEERYDLLTNKVKSLNALGYAHIRVIEAYRVFNLEQYLALRSAFMQAGYEGLVLRDPKAKHKEGRSSAVKPELWRWKPYATAEIKVTRIEEGTTNLNEAIKNELGKTTRSTHKENLQPNGLVGTIVGELIADLKDYAGTVIAPKDTEINVSAGEMKAKDRKYYFENQHEIIEHIVEFSYMCYGLKDKPRFSVYKRIRSINDL